jgi:hypothetical protein
MVQVDLDTIQAACNKYGLHKGEQLCLYLLARNKQLQEQIDEANYNFVQLMDVTQTPSRPELTDTVRQWGGIISEINRKLDITDSSLTLERTKQLFGIVHRTKNLLGVASSANIETGIKNLLTNVRDMQNRPSNDTNDEGINDGARYVNQRRPSNRVNFDIVDEDTGGDENRMSMARSDWNNSQMTSVIPSKYKRARINEFYGKDNENVSDFLFLLETSFTADRIHDEDKVGIAVGYLREAPLAMYRRLISQGPLTWTQFKDRMMKAYQPFNKEMEFRERLQKLRQNGKFSEYLRQYSLLINQITNMSEMDQIHFFQNGLNFNTAMEVKIARPKTLTEAIDIAQAYDQKFKIYSDKPKQHNENNAGRNYYRNENNGGRNDHRNDNNGGRKKFSTKVRE